MLSEVISGTIHHFRFFLFPIVRTLRRASGVLLCNECSAHQVAVYREKALWTAQGPSLKFVNIPELIHSCMYEPCWQEEGMNVQRTGIFS